jgi:hypothetical protein
VYADLEESNLFLIQVCQESEEQLEEIRGHYRWDGNRCSLLVACAEATFRALNRQRAAGRASTCTLVAVVVATEAVLGALQYAVVPRVHADNCATL